MARERLVILRYNPRFLETEIPRDESGQVVLAPDFPSNEVTRTKTHSIETLYNTPDELILLPRVSNYNRTSPNLLSSNQNTFVFPPNFSSSSQSRFIHRSLSLSLELTKDYESIIIPLTPLETERVNIRT